MLITPEQFKRRFLDYQAEEKKKEPLKTIEGLKDKSQETRKSIEVLRELRGYGK